MSKQSWRRRRWRGREKKKKKWAFGGRKEKKLEKWEKYEVKKRTD